MAAMGQAEQHYVEQLFNFIRNNGGQCRIDTLGGKVPKPPELNGKLSLILEKNKDRFILVKLGNNGDYMVHTVQKGLKRHKFDDPSLKQMFRALFMMAKLFHTRWPSEREHWETDISNKLGLTGISGILFALRSGSYVKVKEGKYLHWNTEKVMDAVNQMPEHLRPRYAEYPQVLSAVDQHTHPQTTVGADAGQKSFKLNDGSKCHLIDDLESLHATFLVDPCTRLLGKGHHSKSYFALDCEGVPDALELIQLATPSGVYIFDCKLLDVELVCRTLEPILTTNAHVKLMHDLHKDAVALGQFGTVSLGGVLDTQLVAEHLWGELHLGFNSLLSKLELKLHPSKDFVHAKMRSGVDLWSERPIPRSYLEYAAMDVSFLREATPSIIEVLSDGEREALIEASTLRARYAATNDGMRAVCFDVANDYALASAELIKVMRPAEGFFGEPLVVESNVDEVISVLPTNLQRKFIEQPTQKKKPHLFERLLQGPSSSQDMEAPEGPLPFDNLSDIVLDIGRRPQCWIEDKRIFLCDDETNVVTPAEIKYIADRLGDFGSDNRAGLNGKLHRFSAIRNRDKDILGITIRVGRHVRGNAAILMDFLMGSDKSILILGEPGSGKTTIVREATRKLAEEKNVLVVDTSNEIAGDGVVPHACIGLARRMMVPSLDQQSSVMVECVQNHTPHVMVIDEIGRPKEVQAARTVKQRGVRMIASAHGDLRRLLKNKDLSGLVGGVEQVTMGDDMARQEAKRKQELAGKLEGENRSFSVSKTKVQRAGEPTFEVIVEVRRGTRHEWKVVADSARAVDKILDGFQYQAQLRTRNPDSGEMRMELIEA